MKQLSRALRCLGLVTCLALLGPNLARADLKSDIESALADKLLRRATVGIKIVRLGNASTDVQVLYSHDAATPLIPASNLKLLTTSAALDRLGPDFKFRTLLLYSAEGDLALIGDGDPTLGDSELLKKTGWTVTTLFEQWAQQLKRNNITSVRSLLIDDSIYDENFVHPHWPADQLHKRYEAGVGGLNLNANCVDFTVQPNGVGQTVSYAIDPSTQYVNVRNTCVGGNENAVWLSRSSGGNDIILRGQTRGASLASVTIHDPSMFAGTVLAETLAHSGVQMSGTVVRDRTVRQQMTAPGARRWATVAIHETPLPAVLARTNKDSMNLYAESLCKRVGFAASGSSGSWENGTAAVGAYLRDVGVNPEEFKLDDGCGLSKENAISANAFTQVLVRDFYGKNRDVFLASLSVAGIDGTLEDRFRGTDLKGRVLGKSGYVNGVRSLSGFLRTADNQWYAFSILMNKAAEHPGVKLLQERIIQSLDSHAGAALAGQAP